MGTVRVAVSANGSGDDANGEDHLFKTVGRQVEGLSLDGVETTHDDSTGVEVVDKIESLCMNCHEDVRYTQAKPKTVMQLSVHPQGETRLLLTKVPYFREIILMSFACEHCGFKNTEIQSAGEIQERGSKITFRLDNAEDLERQIVKSDTAIFRIEEIDLEMPPGRGTLTNIEGIASGIMIDLKAGQSSRQNEDPDSFQKLEWITRFLEEALIGSRFPITVSLNDPAGNSTIERHPEDSKSRKKYLRTEYERTKEQNAALGLGEVEAAATHPEKTADVLEDAGGMEGVDILEGEVYSLPTNCPGCTKPASVKMQMVNVPYFKQCIISAVTCEACGYRTNDVKTGGEVPNKGRTLTLHVKSTEDLSRDILKSETCSMSIPECECELVAGCLGGRFTTVEGLLTQVRKELSSHVFDTEDEEKTGDGMPPEKASQWKEFFARLDRAIKAEFHFRVILSDPLADSYIQNPNAPESDPQLLIEDYERSAEENEELGLDDMRTTLAENGEYVK